MALVTTQNKGAVLPAEILLVEDDHINQLVTAELLKRWGFLVTIANHGKEALEIVRTKSFHVILMDIQMPEMDGCETTRHIRDMNETYFKTVPIIAYTASSLADTNEKVVQLGMDDCISKPLDPREMRAKIEKHVQKQAGPYRLAVDFDQYASGDDMFKGKLIRLMVENLKELKASAVTAGTTRDFQVFSKACHKVSPTIIMLNDPALDSAIDEIQVLLKNRPGKIILQKQVHRFDEMCGRIIESLEQELARTLRLMLGKAATVR